MPKGSSAQRLNSIRAEGAEASITKFNYDDAVRLADKNAKENDWVLVQDTAWKGYMDIPQWIMQGYMTMAHEAYEQMRNEIPTHIFIQAGVGSLAGAVVGFFSHVYGDNRPVMAVIEPNEADCIYQTAKANDGKRHFVTGQMDTIMAGLACGEPNVISWPILNDYCDHFISIPDYVAAKGMRVLGSPLPGDVPIISGESGAATVGFLMEVLTDPKLQPLKEKLQLTEKSKILLFSTEGDTDKESYRRILWDGAYSVPRR